MHYPLFFKSWYTFFFCHTPTVRVPCRLRCVNSAARNMFVIRFTPSASVTRYPVYFIDRAIYLFFLNVVLLSRFPWRFMSCAAFHIACRDCAGQQAVVAVRRCLIVVRPPADILSQSLPYQHPFVNGHFTWFTLELCAADSCCKLVSRLHSRQSVAREAMLYAIAMCIIEQSRWLNNICA